jgi:hypothetical protein
LRVAFAYTHGDGNSDGDGIGNAYSDDDAKADTDAETSAYTKAASHTGASAVTVRTLRSFLRGLAKQFASSRKP